jgi:hypothetical protein
MILDDRGDQYQISVCGPPSRSHGSGRNQQRRGGSGRLHLYPYASAVSRPGQFSLFDSQLTTNPCLIVERTENATPHQMTERYCASVAWFRSGNARAVGDDV